MAGGGNTNRLTLLADPYQSIYYKGIPWSDGDIKIHGSCVRLLRKNYRNSRRILDAAWQLIKDDKQKPEDHIEPEKATREGRPPIIYMTPNKSDQQKKAIKEIIINLHKNNEYRLGDISVLTLKNDDVDGITFYLNNLGIPVCRFRDNEFDIFENNIKVITFHSAKGLEFPVVILANVDEGNFPLNHIAKIDDEDEKEMEMRLNRQLLYVGMTRASELLYIVSTEGKTSRFIKNINRNLLNQHSFSG